jgi:hypothetical protein
MELNLEQKVFEIGKLVLIIDRKEKVVLLSDISQDSIYNPFQINNDDIRDTCGHIISSSNSLSQVEAQKKKSEIKKEFDQRIELLKERSKFQLFDIYYMNQIKIINQANTKSLVGLFILEEYLNHAIEIYNADMPAIDFQDNPFEEKKDDIQKLKIDKHLQYYEELSKIVYDKISQIKFTIDDSIYRQYEVEAISLLSQ